MDVTTIQCGTTTRDLLRSYKQANGYQNYDEALRNLLQRAEGEEHRLKDAEPQDIPEDAERDENDNPVFDQ